MVVLTLMSLAIVLQGTYQIPFLFKQPDFYCPVSGHPKLVPCTRTDYCRHQKEGAVKVQFESFVTKFELYCKDGQPYNIKDSVCFYLFLAGTVASFISSMLIDCVGRRVFIYLLLALSILATLLIQFDYRSWWILSINLSNISSQLFYSVIFIYLGEVMTKKNRNFLT